jgi:hypothetical protein
MMSKRSRAAGILLGVLVVALPIAAGQTPKTPHWTHAFDLRCRKNTEPEFSDKTKAFGVEVFKDENNGCGIYIDEVGDLALAANFATVAAPLSNVKAPDWLHGLDLKCRRGGEVDFAKARVFGIEVFRDPNTGDWIYISETGAIAVAAGAKSAPAPTASPKAPTWMHGLDLKCRKAGEKEFSKDTKVWGVEVFRDENNGNLIYVTETGNVSVVPGFASAKAPTPDSKAPEWLHGLDLRCRRGGEKDFTKGTKVYGLEVFRDVNNGNLIYLGETGTLAAVQPGKKDLKAPTANALQPRWTHGLDLKVRKSGEKDFTPTTRVWGVEVFNDDNTGVTLYLGELGALSAVTAAKK